MTRIGLAEIDKRSLLPTADLQNVKTTQTMKKINYLSIALLSTTLCLANQANAAIKYSGIKNVTYSAFSSVFEFSLFDAPGNWDDIYLTLDAFEFADEKRYSFQNLLSVHGNYVDFARGAEWFDIKNFSYGDTIDLSNLWSAGMYRDFSYYSQSTWTDPDYSYTTTIENGEFRNTSGYTGIRLTDGDNVYLGWIQVSVTDYDNMNITGTLIDWAYEDIPGQSIQAGVVPEPSTYALLFMTGAGALWLARKRR